jgi:hypothetical protein
MSTVAKPLDAMAGSGWLRTACTPSTAMPSDRQRASTAEQ